MAHSVSKVPQPVTFCESTISFFGRGSTCVGGNMQHMAQESVTWYSWEKLMRNCSDNELGPAKLFIEWLSFYWQNVFHPMKFTT